MSVEMILLLKILLDETYRAKKVTEKIYQEDEDDE